MSRRWRENRRENARLVEALRRMAGPDGRIPVDTDGPHPLIEGQDVSAYRMLTGEVLVQVRCARCHEPRAFVQRAGDGNLVLTMRGMRYRAVLGSHPNHRFAIKCCGINPSV